MAGARGHKAGTIFSRIRGMIKTNLIPQNRRPLWYDVWETFPPKVAPDFQRPIPDQTVRKILYPEDLVRAKMDDAYQNTEIFNLKCSEELDVKSETQRFVESYIDLQKPGQSVDNVMNNAQEIVDGEGKLFKRKKQKEVKPVDRLK